MANVVVRAISATETHDLRRRVLRDGLPDVPFTDTRDDQPGTVHLGAFYEGRLTGVATLVEEAPPWDPALRALRLRYMGVDPEWQRRGIGREICRSAMSEAEFRGFSILWAHARLTALGFYLNLGFQSVGTEYIEAATQLPHQLVKYPCER